MPLCIRVKALKHIYDLIGYTRKMSAQQYYNNKSNQMSLPKNSPNLFPATASVCTVPAFPTIQLQVPSEEHYQQPIYQSSLQPIQLIQQVGAMIYFVNDVPYYCYHQQPDILYPVYVPDFSYLHQQQEKPRVLGDVVSAVGDVLENKVNSLENYVNNMEQQQITVTQEKIKSSCYNWCL